MITILGMPKLRATLRLGPLDSTQVPAEYHESDTVDLITKGFEHAGL